MAKERKFDEQENAGDPNFTGPNADEKKERFDEAHRYSEEHGKLSTADLARAGRPQTESPAVVGGRIIPEGQPSGDAGRASAPSTSSVTATSSQSGAAAVRQRERQTSDPLLNNAQPQQTERLARPQHAMQAEEPSAHAGATAPLFTPARSQELRERWAAIQLAFVDEPRRCVEQADALVADTMKRLAEIFAKERESLEDQWDKGGEVSTEDLRVAVQRYRSFFDRLLKI